MSRGFWFFQASAQGPAAAMSELTALARELSSSPQEREFFRQKVLFLESELQGA